MRYAAEPPRAQPRLRSALGLRPRLRASFKSAETADFQRRLSVRAFPGHFSALSGAPGPKNGPPRPHFTKKRPQKALQGRLQLAPSVPLRGKLGATCFTAAYLPGADSGPRPAPSRLRGARRDWGQAYGLPWYGLSILGHYFNSPPMKSAPPATPPSHLRAREIPDLATGKTARALRRTRSGCG